MSLAALIRDMAAAGASPEAIAIAVEAIERAQVAADAPRAAARERKRKQRERDRERERDMSRDSHAPVTGQGCDIPAPSPSPLPPPCTPHQPHAPTPTREGNPARTRKGGAWPCPDGIDPQHWADLQANRRAKRMALTPTALEHQLRQIEKFTSDEWPPGRIVRHAAAKGWAAIHDPREPHENRNGKRPHNDDRPRSRGLLGAVLDAEHDSRAGFGF